MLLLTDWRWRRGTGRLIRAIEESKLVPPEDLDLLAGVPGRRRRVVLGGPGGRWLAENLITARIGAEAGNATTVDVVRS